MLLLQTIFLVSSVSIISAQQERVNGRGVKVEAVTEPVKFGKGPLWSDTQNCLYFVDLDSRILLKYNATNEVLSRISVPPGDKPISFVLNTEDDSTLVISRKRDVVVIRVDEHDTASIIRTIASVENDKPNNQLNEARADAKGRLFAGTVGPEGPNGEIPSGGHASLYRLEENSMFKTVATGIDLSNGLAWSLDNTKLYYVDTGTNRVDVFDYDIETGEATNRRPAFDFAKHNIAGVPDAMTIDSNGMLWIACYAGSQVIQVDPENDRHLNSIILPVSLVTSVVFGGANFDTLYVTTSRHLLTAEQLMQQPLAGSTFRVTGLQARGLPEHRVRLPKIQTSSLQPMQSLIFRNMQSTNTPSGLHSVRAAMWQMKARQFRENLRKHHNFMRTFWNLS